MKFTHRLLPLLTLGSIIISAFQLLYHEHEHRLLPISGRTKILGKEEGESERDELRKREVWLERIHRVAPGTDWRAMDAQTRKNRYQMQQGSAKSNGGAVVIANGFLSGQWVEKGSRNLAGRTRWTDYDPVSGKLYLASDGGNIWRGNIDGSGWEVLNDQWQFEDVCFVQALRQTGTLSLVAGTWNNVATFSRDSGATWQQASGFEDLNAWPRRIERMAVADDSIGTIYVLAMAPPAGGGSNAWFVYRSIDQGASYHRYVQVPGTSGAASGTADLWLPRYGTSEPFVVYNNQCYRVNTSDSSIVATGTLASGISGYVMLSGHRENSGNCLLYAYVNQRIYRSADNGQTWEFKTNLGLDPFFKTSFSASVNTPDVLFFGDIECHRSTDGGFAWTTISSWTEYYDLMEHRLHADIPSVNCLRKADGTEFQIINTDGGAFYSENFATIVSNISLEGLHIGQYYASFSPAYDTTQLLLGAQDQGLQRSTQETNGIRSFEQVVSGDYGHLVSSGPGSSLWMVYPGFAAYYPFTGDDANVTWDFDGNNNYWMPPLMPDPFEETICYLANGLRMMKLEYNGSGLTATQLGQNFVGGISAMATSPVDPNRWYVLTESGRFYTSTNAGQTWSFSNISGAPGANYLYGNCVLPSTVNPDVVYIGGSGYSNAPVFKSSNNGQSFTAMNAGLPSTMVFRMAAVPGDEFIFAATEVGPYVYLPSENTWFDLAQGIAPDESYWWVEYLADRKIARFSTYGRGAWDFRIGSPLKTVAPATLSLAVYPNPATEVVHIKPPSSGKVDLWLYDLSGKLVLQQQLQGEGTLQGIGALPRGMYVLISRQAERRSMHKLILR